MDRSSIAGYAKSWRMGNATQKSKAQDKEERKEQKGSRPPSSGLQAEHPPSSLPTLNRVYNHQTDAQTHRQSNTRTDQLQCRVEPAQVRRTRARGLVRDEVEQAAVT
jgi:hypothetical protein